MTAALAFWQSAQPTFTAQHVLMALGVLSGVVVLVKGGAWFGDMNRTIKAVGEDVGEMKVAVKELTATIGEHAKTFASVVAQLQNVVEQVRLHDTRLARLEGVLGG